MVGDGRRRIDAIGEWCIADPGGAPPTGGEVAAWLLAPRMIKDWQAYWFRA